MGLYKYFLLPFLFREVDNLKLPGLPNHTEYPGQAQVRGSLLVPGWDGSGTDWGG